MRESKTRVWERTNCIRLGYVFETKRNMWCSCIFVALILFALVHIEGNWDQLDKEMEDAGRDETRQDGLRAWRLWRAPCRRDASSSPLTKTVLRLRSLHCCRCCHWRRQDDSLAPIPEPPAKKETNNKRYKYKHPSLFVLQTKTTQHVPCFYVHKKGNLKHDNNNSLQVDNDIDTSLQWHRKLPGRCNVMRCKKT